jgi:hypothetical protein
VTVRTCGWSLPPAVPMMAPKKNVAVATTQVRRHHGGLSDGGLGGGGAPHSPGGRCGGGCCGGGPHPGWVGWSLMSPPGALSESRTYHYQRANDHPRYASRDLKPKQALPLHPHQPHLWPLPCEEANLLLREVENALTWAAA